MRQYRWFINIAIVSVLLDQLSKGLIVSSLKLHQSIELLANFVHITYVRNPGAAFGILADNSLRLPFFFLVSIVAGIGILWYLKRIQGGSRRLQFGLGLIFSGAVGNLIDRIRFHEVIDFIDIHWYQYHWPAFNIADSAICIGVGLMLIDSWLEEKNKAKIV
ncbi:signal peptidase II [Geopsychrobacter electrodiphilus]|uniref:signal peptidase II n=1 Tax=Geopsychrobacter electrodiphilus TaxID=225196 RepID=UPI00036DCFA1|nr:signal peptidase II [Geopsychrobacter electrodiphilus]